MLKIFSIAQNQFQQREASTLITIRQYLCIVRTTGMQPIVTDRVAWPLSVCRSVTVASPAKMAEPIKMPFGLGTRMSRRNHVRWGPEVLRDIAMATNWDAMYCNWLYGL